MRLDSFVWSLALLVGCQEYNIDEAGPHYGEANPPAVENPVQEDKIVQVTIPLVDILWVVDNSSSMGPYQDALATNFPAFMNYFLDSGLDYHIGVVATEMQKPAFGGKLVEDSLGERFITLETEDPMARFAEMARLGTLVGSVEKGRDAAYTAIELLQDTYNQGFIRDISSVHIMLISDEPDYSLNNVVTKDEFVEYLNDLRADDESVTFNSICQPPTVVGYGGDDYVYVTDRVGGIKHDIREPDWLPVLEALGMQAAGLKREYFLSRLPVVDTIEVKIVINDEAHTTIPFEATEYTYSAMRNSITFDSYVPNPLDEVVIDYTILSSVANTE